MSIPVNMLLMRRVPLFSVLGDEQLESLQKVAIRKDYPRNQVVFAAGEVSQALFIIISGRVKVQVGDDDGKEVIITMLGPGEFFGEMSLIDDEPRSASVVTAEASQFIVIRKEDFLNAVKINTDMSMMIMRGLVKRLREADRKIESLALMDVFGRVARVLLDSAEEENGQRVVKSKISRQEIARMVGASREMVSRVMKTLEVTGHISTEGTKIIIYDTLLATV